MVTDYVICLIKYLINKFRSTIISIVARPRLILENTTFTENYFFVYLTYYSS